MFYFFLVMFILTIYTKASILLNNSLDIVFLSNSSIEIKVVTIVQEQKILKAASNLSMIFCELFLTTDSLQALKYGLNISFHIHVAYNLKFL